MTLQKQRVWRMNMLMSKIENAMEANQILNQDKLVAEFCTYYGTSRRTVMEYLKEFESLNKIVRCGGDVYTKDEYDKQIIAAEVDLEINKKLVEGGEEKYGGPETRSDERATTSTNSTV